jgi:hypothetical protein
MGDHDHHPGQDRTRVGGLGSPAQSTPAAAQVLLRTGAPLSCLVCGGQAFTRREVKLNTSGMSFLGLGWANRSRATARSAAPVASCTRSSMDSWPGTSRLPEGAVRPTSPGNR